VDVAERPVGKRVVHSDITYVEENVGFEPNLERRVQNLALGPKTPSNTLVPLYEAIYNSIHAIQDRFDSRWMDAGRIQIALIDFDSDSPSIEIRDNGVGLDPGNFISFKTYDSGHKISRGGKGVGRLSWLKVFESAELTSVFEIDGERFTRRFLVVLDCPSSGNLRQLAL
jgi:hypothetical protein